MGFTFNDIHSDTYNLAVITKSMNGIGKKRQVKHAVQGRDGEYVFEDGYDNIQIKLEVKLHTDELYTRRKTERKIMAWLANTGELIMDYEKDVMYKVVSTNNSIDIDITGYSLPVDTFEITFECEPIQKQSFYNDSVTWEDATASWDAMGIPWGGYTRTFTGVVDTDVLTIQNIGTYKELPIIKLSGVATTVTIGPFTYANLNGDIYIDCKEQIVYSESGGNKINEISNFTGDFIEIDPGENNFTVSGTITNLDVEFDYKNAYL